MNNIIATKQQFQDQILNNAKPVILDFYAEWCAPCTEIAKPLTQLAEENPHLVLYKINIEEVQEIASEYKIFSIPTIIRFEKGKEIKRIVGADIKSIKELFLD